MMMSLRHSLCRTLSPSHRVAREMGKSYDMNTTYFRLSDCSIVTGRNKIKSRNLFNHESIVG
jgi:hypothetical protein